MATENLTVLSETGGVFSDHTLNSSNFIKDKFEVDLDDATDHMYIGYFKPINCFYVEIATHLAPPANGDFIIEYYNGTDWTELSVEDHTQKFSRSGYLKFDSSVLQQVTVNGIENYYIRVKFIGHVNICGIGCLFSDDCALQEESYEIVDECYFSNGFKSHIISHVAARNYIMQQLRNMGYVKYTDKCEKDDIVCFDLLNVGEVRQAATYLTLSKIYLSLADSQESIEWAKYQEYQNMYESTFSALKITLDTNNNGKKDSKDKVATGSRSFNWKR